MKKMQYLSLFLCLILTLTLLAFFTACKRDADNPPSELPAHTNNEVASYFYGYSRKHQMLFRYEFNAAGRPLGAIAVDWYTLEPLSSIDGNTSYDRHYEYDHNGRLIGHTIRNTSLTLEYDELGNPVRGVGFDHIGSIVTVMYTCSEQGDVLEEQFTYHAPTVEVTYRQAVRYTYEEDGRLRGEDDYWYAYSKDVISFYVLHVGGSEIEARITLGENGDILSVEIPSTDFRYDWTYDKDGRCVSSEGNTFDYGLNVVCECRTVRDESGHLLEADITRECDLPGAAIVRARYCLTYDETGAHTQTAIHILDDAGNDTGREVIDFSGGLCVKHLSHSQISVDDAGEETIGYTVLSEYDSSTGKMVKTCLYLQGDLREEMTFSYDTLGRWVVSVNKEYDQYNPGVLYSEERVEYEYGEKEDVVKKTTISTDHARGTWGAETYEYENGMKVRRVSESEYSDAGKRIRMWGDKQIDPETETTIHSIWKRYENGVLIEEEETTVDYLSEHIWTKIFDRTLYTDGKISIKVRSEDLDDGRVVTQEKQYENDILIQVKTTRQEPKKWTNGEWTKYSRPTSETYEYYEKDGSFDRREEWEYAYHENGYRSGTLCQTYDSENKMLSYQMETYDEEGNLVSSVTG